MWTVTTAATRLLHSCLILGGVLFDLADRKQRYYTLTFLHGCVLWSVYIKPMCCGGAELPCPAEEEEEGG